MFDANARHLAKGREFFGKVHYIDDEHQLAKFGVLKGDLILCTMLEKERWNPLIKVHLNQCDVELRPCDDEEAAWIVFEGTKELTSFICDKSLARAKKMLKDWE